MRKYLYFILMLSLSLWMSAGCGKSQNDTAKKQNPFQNPSNTPQTNQRLPFYGTWYTEQDCYPVTFSNAAGSFEYYSFSYKVLSSTQKQKGSFKLSVQFNSFSPEEWTLTFESKNSIRLLTQAKGAQATQDQYEYFLSRENPCFHWGSSGFSYHYSF